MDKQTQALRDALGTLADDAHALMVATTDVAGHKAEQARERLATALAQAKETYSRVRDKMVDQRKSVDTSVHEYPYESIGIAFGLGVLIGLLLKPTPRARVDRAQKAPELMD